jgi:hypothetical protein
MARAWFPVGLLACCRGLAWEGRSPVALPPLSSATALCQAWQERCTVPYVWWVC